MAGARVAVTPAPAPTPAPVATRWVGRPGSHPGRPRQPLRMDTGERQPQPAEGATHRRCESFDGRYRLRSALPSPRDAEAVVGPTQSPTRVVEVIEAAKATKAADRRKDRPSGAAHRQDAASRGTKRFVGLSGTEPAFRHRPVARRLPLLGSMAGDSFAPRERRGVSTDHRRPRRPAARRSRIRRHRLSVRSRTRPHAPRHVSPQSPPWPASPPALEHSH